MPTHLSFVLQLAIITSCAAASRESQPAIAILRDLGKAAGLFIGSAAGVSHFQNDPQYNLTLGQQFSLVTPENACKWTATEPTNGKFDFTECDFILNVTMTFKQVFRGHNLCWGVHNPSWLQTLAGNKTALIDVLTRHVHTVASRYKGKAYAWDVVNEAVLDNPTSNQSLKTNIWYPAVSNYIDLAFKTAHEADPQAKLFYNDYNSDGLNGKSNAIYEMLKSMIQRGIPVHGVGLQSHFTLGDDFTQMKNPKLGRPAPSYNDMAANIKRLADLGLEVHITELDVSFAGGTGTEQQKLQQQAEVYGNVLKACLSNKMCKSYEVWGYIDKYSWRKSNYEPDLFDSNYKPKPCFDTVAAMLQNKTVV